MNWPRPSPRSWPARPARASTRAPSSACGPPSRALDPAGAPPGYQAGSRTDRHPGSGYGSDGEFLEAVSDAEDQICDWLHDANQLQEQVTAALGKAHADRERAQQDLASRPAGPGRRVRHAHQEGLRRLPRPQGRRDRRRRGGHRRRGGTDQGRHPAHRHLRGHRRDPGPARPPAPRRPAGAPPGAARPRRGLRADLRVHPPRREDAPPRQVDRGRRRHETGRRVPPGTRAGASQPRLPRPPAPAQQGGSPRRQHVAFHRGGTRPVGGRGTRHVTSSGTRRAGWLRRDATAVRLVPGPIPERARRDAICCSVRCRQARHRFLRAAGQAGPVAGGRPLRLAYADPPYPATRGCTAATRTTPGRSTTRR